MKKNYANIVTTLRILLSVVILFLQFNSIEFYLVYLICGFTDALDGFVARKTNSCSELGSKLDTVSDILFFVIVILKILINVKLVFVIYLLAGIVTLVKLLSFGIYYFRNKKILDNHSILNKISGILLFALPLLFCVLREDLSTLVITLVCLLFALYELIFVILGKI